MCKEPSLQRCRTVDRRRQSSAEAAHRRGVVQSGITPADVTGRTSYVARTLTKLPSVSPSRLVMHCDVATGTRRMPGQQRYLTHRYTHVYLRACMCTCVHGATYCEYTCTPTLVQQIWRLVEELLTVVILLLPHRVRKSNVMNTYKYMEGILTDIFYTTW